jgi:hypothetical protein
MSEVFDANRTASNQAVSELESPGIRSFFEDPAPAQNGKASPGRQSRARRSTPVKAHLCACHHSAKAKAALVSGT